jgi:hypothetical protein
MTDQEGVKCFGERRATVSIVWYIHWKRSSIMFTYDICKHFVAKKRNLQRDDYNAKGALNKFNPTHGLCMLNAASTQLPSPTPPH